jgi:hypothetical protein
MSEKNFMSGLLSPIAKSNYKIVGSESSGYGHSGGHSGYETSQEGGYDGHHSGYGQKEECCPLVVDLLCLGVILASIAFASVLLGRVIQIEITGLGKRSFMSFLDNVTYPSWLVSGESYL